MLLRFSEQIHFKWVFKGEPKTTMVIELKCSNICRHNYGHDPKSLFYACSKNLYLLGVQILDLLFGLWTDFW